MIRPIDTNMSLFTVDHKAHQAQNDPNAHTTLAAQQAEAMKKAENQMRAVQKSPEAEGEVKIRDKDSEKNRRDQRKRRRGNNADTEDGAEAQAKDAGEAPAKDAGDGRFDFLA